MHLEWYIEWLIVSAYLIFPLTGLMFCALLRERRKIENARRALLETRRFMWSKKR